jgi:hypothetical protein
MVATVNQELIFEVLWRMKVLTGRLLTVTPTLDGVVAGDDPAILDLDIVGGVCELAFVVRTGALISLIFAAHF